MIWPLGGKRRGNKSEYFEVDAEEIHLEVGNFDSGAQRDPDAVLKTVYRVSVRTISNRVQIREYDSLEQAREVAIALSKASQDERVRRFEEALHRQKRERTGRAAYIRAAGWLDNLALVLPTRIVNEDLGDVLEQINRRAMQGQSSFKIYLRTLSSMFWLIANAIGYLVRAVGARKSA
jgi:hypothetical protein